MELKDKCIIVTGGTSGIGRATAQLLAESGAKVFAGSRRAQTGAETAQGITEIKLDVTSDESVKRAVDYVMCQTGRIDAIVCCAGIGISGAVEDVSASEAMEQLDTNFCGVLRLCNAVMPIMRDQKSGYIVNIGSVAGFFSIPFQSMYSCSKYALEALTEAIRMEAEPFGIRAALVEPGDTRTGFTDARAYSLKTRTNDAYREEFSRAISSMSKSELNGRAPVTAAKAAVRLLRRAHPPVRTVVGAEYKALVFLKRLMPPRFTLWVLRKMYCSAPMASKEIWDFERNVLKKQ